MPLSAIVFVIHKAERSWNTDTAGSDVDRLNSQPRIKSNIATR